MLKGYFLHLRPGNVPKFDRGVQLKALLDPGAAVFEG
jgi:hypothetical protein